MIPRHAVLGMVAGFVLSVPKAGAQDIPEFNKLRTPISPAFTILGIAPSHIERPTLPSSFAASVLQQAENISTSLPKAFALDVAPYWLFRHPSLSLTKYKRAGMFENAYRNATVSFATTDSNGVGGGAPAGNASFRRLGFGLRTTLVGKDTVLPQCITTINRAATTLAVAIGSHVSAAIQANPALATDAAALEALKGTIYSKLLDSLPAADKKALKDGVKSCTEQLSAREGFVMDVAGATAATFPSGRADAGKFSSTGFWVTPAYLTDAFSYVGVARFRRDDLNTDSTSTVIDLGMRVVHTWDRFAASVEGVGRSIQRSDSTKQFVRVSLEFDAKISDQTWLNLSFGKDFDPRKPNSLIALIGFQWQLSDRSVRPDIP